MATKPKGDLLFDISEREAGMLQQSIEIDSKRAWQRFELYRTQLSEIEQQLEQAAANIARAPEDEQLMDLFEKLRDTDRQREAQLQKYRSLLEDAKRKNSSNWIVFVRFKKRMTPLVISTVIAVRLRMLRKR